MESKTCNNCGKSKPVNLFYLLNKKKPWRRAACIKCHNRKDKRNRKIRKAIVMILLIIASTISVGQTLLEKRQHILDSINYYREDPTRTESYGLNLKSYPPQASYVMDDKINRSAQRWANRMARTLNYRHSNTIKYAESIDCVQDWEGGYTGTVQRLIVDQYVRNKGHRRHLLRCKDTFIGIGVARVKGGKETYICVQTR